jgi:hypothetical protein
LKIIATLALVFLVTGCAALPLSGPVRIGPDLTPNIENESIYYSPSGPIDGSSQVEILNGFLAAGTGPQNDYSVAREFLSSSLSATWNPNQEVLIQRQGPKVTIGSNGTAQIEIDVIAKLDANGRYQSFPSGTSRILDYEFVLEGNQWRLSRAPDATVLIRPVFEVVFKDYAIYFIDRQKRFLVPEMRWFPSTAATGTKLANALLGGPSSWLAPAVISAIPGGTRLSIDAVTVEDGVALVDLTARALVASQGDRILLKAQLDATLSQLSNVRSVAVSIERSRQEIDQPEVNLTTLGARSLIALGESGLEKVAGSGDSFLNSGVDFFNLNRVTEIAVSERANFLAALTEERVLRTGLDSIGENVDSVDSRTEIRKIEFDRQDYLWSFSSVRGNNFLVTATTSEQGKVSARWLADDDVRAFSISPEGSRIAVLLASGQRNRVLVAGIIRDQSGMPIEISTPIEIAGEVLNPIQVSWVGPMTIALVNSTPDITNAVLVSIGGTSRAISAPPDTRQIVAVGPASQLYLLNRSGSLFRFTGSSWSLIRDDVKALSILN